MGGYGVNVYVLMWNSSINLSIPKTKTDRIEGKSCRIRLVHFLLTRYQLYHTVIVPHQYMLENVHDVKIINQAFNIFFF